MTNEKKKKLDLVKHTDEKGKIWYWIEVDGTIKSSAYFEDEYQQVLSIFDAFKLAEPTKEIIKTKEL